MRWVTTTDLMLVPPGEVLLEKFLSPMAISQYRLAILIGLPESRSADTDLRLCRFFGSGGAAAYDSAVAAHLMIRTTLL